MKSIRNGLGAALWAGALLAGGVTGMAVAADPAADPATDSATGTAPATATRDAGAHHGFGRGFGHLYGKLGLTTEQQSELRSIMTAARPQMKTLHEQLRANHLKLMQTPPDDANYSSVVAAVAQSNASLAAQRTTQGAQVQAQIYALLTPAQRTQLAGLEAQWAARPHHGHRGEASAAAAGV